MPNISRIVLNKQELFKLCICFENIVYVYVCAHEMTSFLIIKSSHCIKITFKPWLKWKSAWNKSCISWNSEQVWYSKVFHLTSGNRRKIEFTKKHALQFNYKMPLSPSSSPHLTSPCVLPTAVPYAGVDSWPDHAPRPQPNCGRTTWIIPAQVRWPSP